jgi:hypothetical protein
MGFLGELYREARSNGRRLIGSAHSRSFCTS